MANVSPFFVTGANCKIKVNGLTLAFATDLSYSVSIPHTKARVLGSYEVDSLEPLSYDVGGSFTVIRYISDLKSKLASQGIAAPSSVSDLGNGIGSWTKINTDSHIARRLGDGSDGRADRSLIPASLKDAVTFDIEIYQKLPNGETLGISRIRNARITQMGTQITKRGLMVQNFQFSAQFLDEDSFMADSSSFTR
jgi:hypothetical protein